MAGTTLTAAQSKKLDTVVGKLETSLKIKDEKVKANLRRFADKYARFKLGVRGTGPHSHGFSADQRNKIMEAVREAYGIKTAPKPKANGKPATKPVAKKRSTRKSTAQLAQEQVARAEA